ncbi:MAG: SEC-C metal-binding domain-containing protein [Acidimicrobiia bacterium]
MTHSRQILRKIDDTLRAEFDQEQGEWMAKVPISGATKVVWQRYCQAVGVSMGEGVALLMLHELATVAGEHSERLADRLHTQEAEIKARAQELNDREKDLTQRERTLSSREADLEDRLTDLAAREQNVAALGQNLAQRLGASSGPQTAGSSKPTLGRNEPCWCKSGKKYKHCHSAG